MIKMAKISVVTFFVSLVLCSVVVLLSINNSLNVDRLNMERMLIARVQSIDGVLSRLFYRTEILATLVLHGGGYIEDFDIIAPVIADDHSILNILLAPDGIVTSIYSPVVYQGDFVGHDFFGDFDGNLEALKALEIGELLMAGPFVGRQGYMVIAGRLPVFLDEYRQDLWGLVSVTLLFPEALDYADLDSLTGYGYGYELWRINPDTNERQVLLSNTEGMSGFTPRYVERGINIQGATWFLRLYSTVRWYNSTEVLVLIVGSLIISVLAAKMVENNHRLSRLKIVLEGEKERAETAHRIVMLNIAYSSQIQRKLLSSKDIFSEAFADSSVVWRPRDVVGGDMYWVKQFSGGSVVCVMDCTGHGISGALLTMLVVSALENAVNADNCHDTAEAVWRVEQRLADVFGTGEQMNYEIMDGCDMAVMFVENDGSVTLSAGNMNVFVCDGQTYTRYKGQRLFIGEGRISDKLKIKTIHIPSSPENKFYISSDGLFEQPNAGHRPFGYERLCQIILKNHNESQEYITECVLGAFESHMGEEEQVDDVVFVSFKPLSLTANMQK
ncbi:MAG: SpoIIE family protein phosphatase [Defluviitaleaceae bacterium]|nr:SpoIIE family protein phosphatase [Defluviitaleaceae bacterium]